MRLEFLENDYRIAQQREKELFNALEEMESIYKEAINEEVNDYVGLLKEPVNFIVEKYWSLYCKDKPQHLDKARVFNADTGIDLNRLEGAKKAFYKAFEGLKDSAPTITKKGVKSNLNNEDYCLYLDESKKEEYDDLVAFVEAANTLREKHGAFGGMNLVRFANKLQMDNAGWVKVDMYHFGKKSTFKKAV